MSSFFFFRYNQLWSLFELAIFLKADKKTKVSEIQKFISVFFK